MLVHGAIFSFDLVDINFSQFMINFDFSRISLIFDSEVLVGGFSFFTINVVARWSFGDDVVPLLDFTSFLLEFSCSRVRCR